MLKSLEISQIDWKIIDVLIKNLKPLFDATTILSGQQYPTLSISKFIENALFCFFETYSSTNISTQNKVINDIDNTIKESLLEQLEKYFKTNQSFEQETTKLVIFIFF